MSTAGNKKQKKGHVGPNKECYFWFLVVRACKIHFAQHQNPVVYEVEMFQREELWAICRKLLQVA